MSHATAPTAVDARIETVQLRHIPLSRIVIPEGFNPRGQVEEDRELERLADSIRRHGVLQPIRVRATEHGDYVLIAGERRYRAAVKAAIMELPAIIHPAAAGGEDEEATLLMEAVLENDQRADLDPHTVRRQLLELVSDRGEVIEQAPPALLADRQVFRHVSDRPLRRRAAGARTRCTAAVWPASGLAEIA